MSDAGNILDLVERLHPTPAVGGYPTDRALSIMRELEEIDRGWYAGPFGWTDLDGSGEFAVAIRSALLSGRMASLFAGSGIVADSVPSAEYEETCLEAASDALGARCGVTLDPGVANLDLACALVDAACQQAACAMR